MNRLLHWVNVRLDHRQERGRIARNSGWLISDKVVRALVGLPVTILLTRYLGTESFGQWSFVVAWISILSTIAGLGLDSIVVRELVRNPERASAIVVSGLVMKFVAGASLAILGMAGLARLEHSDVVIVGLTSILVGTLLFQAMDVADYWFQARVASRHAVTARIGAFLAAQTVKIILILAHAPLQAFAWAQLAESGLVAALLYATLANHAGERLRLTSFDPTLARRLLKDALPLLVAGIAVVLYMRIDVLMLERMSSPHEVGIYSAATRLSEFWYAIPMAWVASASPSLLANHVANPCEFERRMGVMYRVLFWVGVLASAATTLVSGPLVRLLYGEAFSAAGPVLALHVWAGVPVFLGVASSQYLLAENLQVLSLVRTVLGLGINLLLNMALIPKYGALGAAAATVVSYAAATLAIGIRRDSRSHAMHMLKSPFVSSTYKPR